MRWALAWMAATFLAVGIARPTDTSADIALSGPSFPVGNLKFTIPSKWKIEPVEGPARGGQWRIPPLRPDGEGGRVVAFYFGPGVGGSPQDNIEAWVGTMSNVDGRPAAKKVKQHQANGLKVTQVVLFGTYNQVVSLPGVPPAVKLNYGLLGAVIENTQGNIYWRFTGPEPLVTANLPLFNKVIDSVKPQDQP